jgi:hypothetical protein
MYCLNVYRVLKLQRLQNNSVRAFEKFSERTPTRGLHGSCEIPYVYDFVTKLCRQQAGVVLKHEKADICSVGKAKPSAGNTVEAGYNDSDLYDTSPIASDILWYQLIPHC